LDQNKKTKNITLKVERPTADRVKLEEVAIQLHPTDDVAIARQTLMPRLALDTGNQNVINVRQLVQPGHKVALKTLKAGDPVRRYGQIIGFATQPIEAGDHVHTHNLGAQEFTRDYAFASEDRPVELLSPDQRRTFMGYKRTSGQVGTRNYIAILGSVNCSASAIRLAANSFGPEQLNTI